MPNMWEELHQVVLKKDLLPPATYCSILAYDGREWVLEGLGV